MQKLEKLLKLLSALFYRFSYGRVKVTARIMNASVSRNVIPGPRDDPLPSNFFMTILLVIAFAILMYAFRPNSLRSNSRQSSNDTVKDRDNERDSNNDPPAPPPTA
ncbi:hypothetical protein E2986_14136 [Frieseomelitta varia]|uniref:Uncharacterized protein n=1 Tax=Frieseomelitta varia TaxID=561572 RepID=A0A833RS07_9HYME|nr:hypothetical protein E2986_14136 [Frieseomelitta varia]